MTEDERAAIHKELAAIYENVARRRQALADSILRLEALRATTTETTRRLMAHAATLEERLANDVQPTR